MILNTRIPRPPGDEYKSYCPFCENNLATDGEEPDGMYNCKYCVPGVRFICRGAINKPKVAYTQFSIDNYII